MSAIQFVVRGDAGVVVRGLAGDGPIAVLPGQDVSLNLQRSQILSYTRDGSALQVTLVNGEVIVIDGFFGSGGPVADLFISSSGQLAAVDLSNGEGALLYARYGDIDAVAGAKWSPDDALYFTSDGALELAGVSDAGQVGMLGVPFLTGLGSVGGAAAGAGLLGLGAAAAIGNGGEDREPPEVSIVTGTKDAGHVVNAADHADGVDFSGQGTPGASGVIQVAGVEKPIEIDGDGSWSATFTPDELLGGEYEADIVVTVTNDGGSSSTVGTVVVDTVASVTFDADAVEGDGVINGVEEADGFVLTGETQPGSTVTVTFGGDSYDAVVTGSTWQLDVPAGVIAQGEYDLDVVVSATDENGNTAATSGTVVIDTITSVTLSAESGADGVINAVEHAGGVHLSGAAQAGAQVFVTLGGASQTVTAQSDGTWQATFAPGDVPEGTYQADMSAVATDANGNTATATGVLDIDTTLSVSVDTASVETDGIVNLVEREDGVTLTGTADPGASVSVVFAGVTATTIASDSGAWSVDYPASDVPEGELSVPVDVTATDNAGNVAMASGQVAIDTQIHVSVETAGLEGDGTVNAVERADGITLSGGSQPGAAIWVEFAGATQAVVADGNGQWSADFAAGQVPVGELQAPVTVTATDAAGNVATTSATVAIDTQVGVTLNVAGLETDGVVNFVERDDGITLVGTSDPGASVTVSFAGTVRTVATDDNGNWSADYAATEVPQGEVQVPVHVTASDQAGNTASTSGMVVIDTFVNRLNASDGAVEGDGIVNNAEASDGISLSGTVEAGSRVMVTFEGTTRSASVDAQGGWSVTFAPEEVPAGEYQTEVQITATDAAGNTASITETFAVDTDAPDAPNIESFMKGEDGLRGFGIENAGDEITASEYVEGAEAATAVDLGSGGFLNPITGEMYYGFAGGHEVPNGSHLVITANDDAGNSNSTLFVLDDSAGESAIDVTAGALSGQNIGAIDLELFAEEASITLSAADIAALSNNNNTLVINGKSDDTVTLNGTATAVGQEVIDGHDYTVYDVGEDATRLVIRDEIEFQQAVI